MVCNVGITLRHDSIDVTDCSGTGKNVTNNGKTSDALSRAADRYLILSIKKATLLAAFFLRAENYSFPTPARCARLRSFSVK